MRLLELNLASRPFRNNALVWAAYLVLLGAALGFTYWNVSSFGYYERQLVELDAIQGNMETEQRDLNNRHGQIVRTVGTFDVKAIDRRTSKANQVIEWKAFSWTRLFNRLEEMLPYTVRMTSVRPIFREADRTHEETDLRQSISVSVEGLARDLDSFLQIQTKLIDHASFGDVRPRYVERVDNGEYSFAVDFLYYPEEADDDGAPPEAVASAPDAQDEPVADRLAAGAAVNTVAATSKLPQASPTPAEVTDDWAEHSEPEVAPAPRGAKGPRSKKRALPPAVDPAAPERAETNNPGGRR